VNNPKTLITAPFATVTNLRETLNEIGGAIDRGRRRRDDLPREPDGAQQPDRGGAAAARLVELGPCRLKQLLDDAGIKWRIIVVAACYSGGFVEPLADDTRS
jgi:hypothetical protein